MSRVWRDEDEMVPLDRRTIAWMLSIPALWVLGSVLEAWLF